MELIHTRVGETLLWTEKTVEQIGVDWVGDFAKIIAIDI